VQCGVCGYNCPVGIPVRDYARQGRTVEDPACVQCGQCIEACPRGTLRWGRIGPPQPFPVGAPPEVRP
jgi:ferredoxin